MTNRVQHQRNNQENIHLEQPVYYHRDYENDVKNLKPKNTFFQQAQRVITIAMPFLSLYKPFGSVISLGMNATRSFSCLTQTKEALTKGEAKEIGIALFQSSLAATAVVGTIFSNFYAMATTSSHDVLISLYETLQHLNQGDYEKAFENFLQLANNSLYLTMLLHGSLEIVVLSFVAQILVEAYKSQASFRKFKNGDALDVLEGFAHLGMAGIRGYQMQPQLKMLQFKWEIEKALEKRTNRQEKLKELSTTNSNDLTSKLAEKVTVETVMTTGEDSGIVKNQKKEDIPLKAKQKIQGIENTQSSANCDPEYLDVLMKYANNPDDIPALHYAILSHDFKAVKILVENGADVNFFAVSPKQGGKSGDPMQFAINVIDLDIMKYLFSHGAKLYDRHVYLTVAFKFSNGLNFLLENNAPLGDSGRLLFIALSNNSPKELIQSLIAHGADCKYTYTLQYRKRKEDAGLLSLVVQTGDLDLVQLFVEHGAPINYCLDDIILGDRVYTIHYNPLYKAIKCEHKDIAKYLISKGAITSDAHQRWFQYELVEEYYKGLNVKVLQMLLDLQLLDQIRIQNLFEVAIKRDKLVAVKELFASGAKIHDGHLGLAVKTGDRDLVSWLSDHGAKP